MSTEFTEEQAPVCLFTYTINRMRKSRNRFERMHGVHDSGDFQIVAEWDDKIALIREARDSPWSRARFTVWWNNMLEKPTPPY